MCIFQIILRSHLIRRAKDKELKVKRPMHKPTKTLGLTTCKLLWRGIPDLG